MNRTLDEMLNEEPLEDLCKRYEQLDSKLIKLYETAADFEDERRECTWAFSTGVIPQNLDEWRGFVNGVLLSCKAAHIQKREREIKDELQTLQQRIGSVAKIHGWNVQALENHALDLC